jgi:type IX secretion system PorP/SprF family membrane protein
LSSKKYNIKFITTAWFVFAGFITAAQDLHFSQFFNSPLTTNPANTGFLPDADYRIGGNYRNQWSSVMTVPYKTNSLFADAQFLRNKIETGWLGLGAVILNDVAGSGSLRSNKVYASLAYHQQLGLSSLLSAGFNLGWANKRIDVTKLKFPDQFDGKFFDAPTTAVVLTNTSTSYFDMQVGMNYAYFPEESIYINAGYSVHHVNRPRETFFADATNQGRMSMRHIGFLNALLKVNDRVIVNPNVYFTTQAKSRQLMLGINGNYNLTEAGEKQLIAGLYYRVGDAVAPMVGVETNNLRITYSYDATVSSLTNFNNFRGGSEISIIKKGFYPENKYRKTMCPTFY